MDHISICIDDILERDAEALFDCLGLDMSSAITLFLKECVYLRALPFEMLSQASELS